MLQSRLFERAEQISGRRSGRYKDEFDPEKMSILTGVMGITKEVSFVSDPLHTHIPLYTVYMISWKDC